MTKLNGCSHGNPQSYPDFWVPLEDSLGVLGHEFLGFGESHSQLNTLVSVSIHSPYYVHKFLLIHSVQSIQNSLKTAIQYVHLSLGMSRWHRYLGIDLFIWGFTSLSTLYRHITTGSWKGRGNQYIQFVRVLYCKLPTNGKQLPAFPLEAVLGVEPRPQEVRGESVTTLPPWPLSRYRDHFTKIL